MKHLIIGLGSKARIGKDYAAQELAKLFDVQRIAFADALKLDIADIVARHGLDYWAIEKQPELKEKIRPLLVEYGMTMRRFNEDVWVDRALAPGNLTSEVILVTDVRFPNEAKRIRELGGHYIEIMTNTPPINETEAYYSPLMAESAEYTIKNNFDPEFIPDLVNLVFNLWKLTQSKESVHTRSTGESTSLNTLTLKR